MSITDANTGSVFLAYKAKEEVNKIVNNWIKEERLKYDFISEVETTHTCWLIDNKQIIRRLVEAFAKIDYLYIADGHHRAAAATKVSLKRRKWFKNYTGKEEFHFFLSVLSPIMNFILWIIIEW